MQFSHPYWPLGSISWDVFGYYLYLPAAFIYDDPKLENIEWVKAVQEKYEVSLTLYQVHQGPQGNWQINYSMGMAYFYAPFFFLAHAIAHLKGYPADGFSEPYQWAIALGALVFTIIGLVYLRKSLLFLFSDKITAIVIAAIVLGTNYLFQNVYNGTVPHNWLFTAYALILFLTIKWHLEPKLKYALILGFLIGLAALTRPTDVVIAIIPLLWTVKDKHTLKEKWMRLVKYKTHIAVLAFMIFIIGLPQLLYWKVTTGSFLYYSYPADSLDLFNPYFLEVLFSYRCGWLVYTPLMLLAIGGLYFLYKKHRHYFAAVTIFFTINLYLVSSWDCWWYGGSFSQRALTESYAIMSIPLAALVSAVLARKLAYKIVLILVLTALIALNIFQTWQVKQGVIVPDRMTKKYFWSIFADSHVGEEQKELMDIERSYSSSEYFINESDYIKKVMLNEGFEQNMRDTSGVSEDFYYTGKRSFLMDSLSEFLPVLTIKYKELTKKSHAWLRASIHVYPQKNFDSHPFYLVISTEHNNRSYKYKTSEDKNAVINANEWNNLQLDYLTPLIKSKNDVIKIYLWNAGKNTVYVDDIRVEAFEKSHN